MEMLVTNNYILHNPNKRELKCKGFHYNENLSDSESEFYSLLFPVLQYNGITTVHGKIDVDLSNGEVFLNAYDTKKNTSYAPFYKAECPEVYGPIIKKINNAFEAMFEKVGIRNLDKLKRQGD